LESKATILEALESDWENYIQRLKNLREVSIIVDVSSSRYSVEQHYLNSRN
jgi:hypothetical protein